MEVLAIRTFPCLKRLTYFNDQQIEALCQELENEWEDLQNCAKERAKKLELSLKAQQFFFEAGEVESWLTEKNDVLSSADYGRDRDAASKLLAKHKALELELDSYNGIVTEMGHVAEKMVCKFTFEI